MGDIFGYSRTTAKPATVFESSKSILTIQGGSPEGYLVQSWNLNYTQDVSEIFELGSDAVYWVRGRPTGEGTIGRIMGVKGGATGLFPAGAFDACTGGVAMSMSAGGSKCGGGGEVLRVMLDGTVVNRVGFQMNAPSPQGVSGMLNEDVSFKFSYMEVS
jgi:hypothetical protein